MNYIKNHPHCIEEKAIAIFGKTNVFSLAGYILEDGSMLNFSYDGYQRDEDHRIVGQFFKKASGTEAMLKFMRRGNVRVCCNRTHYTFEFIKDLTKSQKDAIIDACREAKDLGIEFVLEKDDSQGHAVKQWYWLEELLY